MTASDLQREIVGIQPDLSVFERFGGYQVQGMYRVQDQHGFLDEFLIEGFLPATYPLDMPVVKELGGRIPLIDSRHANKIDQTLCYMTPEDYALWRHQVEPTPTAFFEGPLRDCFLSHLHFEQNGTWLFGERSHGPEGRLESYCDLFGLPPFADLKRFEILERPLIKLQQRMFRGHDNCVCGSGRLIRRCHPQIIDAQKYFLDKDIKDSLAGLNVLKKCVQNIVNLKLAIKHVAGDSTELAISPYW